MREERETRGDGGGALSFVHQANEVVGLGRDVNCAEWYDESHEYAVYMKRLTFVKARLCEF